ncbi:MAG: nucleoside diphosphate kinase regulator [Pseudohongiella sp.]|nr:MAG: nucleoside diphosphate kinase regulator [Pseudohongiella sp.]
MKMKKIGRKLVIKNSDYEKLQNLIERNDSPAADFLESEISGAKIVVDSKLPDDVVSMGSTVTFTRKDSEEDTVVTLVYPQESNMEEKKISILTPVGSALIGLRKGGEIDWPMPNGKLSHFEVVSVRQV